MNHPERILVIKLSALGDFIIALGAMRAIRTHHAGAHITLLTTKAFESLAIQSGLFNDIIIDQRPKKFDPAGWMRVRNIFKAGRFDRVYDLQNNQRTALYFRLSNMTKPKPHWAGTMAGATWRDVISSKATEPAPLRHARLLALAGIENVRDDDLHWLGGDHDVLRDLFKIPEPYVLIVPGCAPSRPEKRWPADHYGDLARRLYGWGLTPVVIGTHDEQPLAQTIINYCAQAIDLTGQTALSDLPMLGRFAAGAIGNDTGPVHMIAPTGCPTWVLFSASSDPKRHAPQYPWVRTIQRSNLDDLSVNDVMNVLKARDFRT